MPDPSTQKNTQKTATKPAAVAEEPKKVGTGAIVPAATSGLQKRSQVLSGDLVIRDEEMTEVEFNRVYYQARENQNPLYLLPLRVSDDVRKEYKSKYPQPAGQEPTPLFLLAFEVMKSVEVGDNCLFQNKVPVAIPKGEVCFMLIPARLGFTIMAGLKQNMVIRVQATKKVPIQNRAGLDVMAWDFKASVLTQYKVLTQVNTEAIIMPQGEEIAEAEEID